MNDAARAHERIPVLVVENVPAASGKEPAVSAPRDGSGAGTARPGDGETGRRRVLVVEDNLGDADLVRFALEEHPSFAVEHVTRLRDAVAHLSATPVDAVVLDLGLPDATGIECIHQLRRAFPSLPIVVLTGDGAAGIAALRSGVQDFVTKDDLEPQHLQRAINYAIERNAHAQRSRDLAAERAAHEATAASAKALEALHRREAAAREEAEQRREELEALFASMADAILVYDDSGRIQSMNPAAMRFFGVDLRGLTPAGFMAAAGVRGADGSAMPVGELPGSRALRGEVVSGDRLRVRAAAGDRTLLVSAAPVRRGDGVRGAISACRDVTEHDLAERALRESDERKNQFLAVLSHELRNPLAPIRNALYLLDHAEPTGHEARRAKEIATRQVLHLTRLVDDLLDVTRIARGKVQLRRTEVDLGELARRAADDHRPLIEERGQTFAVETASTPVVANGDETRLAQVIGNLLTNAVKFTPAGGRITLSVHAEGSSGVIAVRDTGPGIEPELLNLVFEPFTQGEQTLARSEGGLGLGLALVKGFVELHGGTVSAASPGAGLGTEIAVRVPLSSASTPASRAPLEVPSPPHRHRVLVIDDNKDAADSLADVVQMFGHEVDVAYDGPSALQKAAACPPDVVLCDIGLPGMSGYDVARALRAGASAPLRLIAVSGYAHPDDVGRATEAGFEAHIAKPPDISRLATLLGS